MEMVELVSFLGYRFADARATRARMIVVFSIAGCW
jgi:hypothetical protein